MTHKTRVFLHSSILALLGGCWVGDPADVDPNLPDIDTLNECAQIKNECVGDKNGEIARPNLGTMDLFRIFPWRVSS